MKRRGGGCLSQSPNARSRLLIDCLRKTALGSQLRRVQGCTCTATKCHSGSHPLGLVTQCSATLSPHFSNEINERCELTHLFTEQLTARGSTSMKFQQRSSGAPNCLAHLTELTELIGFDPQNYARVGSRRKLPASACFKLAFGQ